MSVANEVQNSLFLRKMAVDNDDHRSGPSPEMLVDVLKSIDSTINGSNRSDVVTNTKVKEKEPFCVG